MNDRTECDCDMNALLKSFFTFLYIPTTTSELDDVTTKLEPASKEPLGKDENGPPRKEF